MDIDNQTQTQVHEPTLSLCDPSLGFPTFNRREEGASCNVLGMTRFHFSAFLPTASPFQSVYLASLSRFSLTVVSRPPSTEFTEPSPERPWSEEVQSPNPAIYLCNSGLITSILSLHPRFTFIKRA